MVRLNVSDLTRGEKIYLHRKRLGYTQFEMAVDLGVGLSEYRAMELDEEGTRPPYTTLHKLEPHEACATWRRREGISKEQLALELGVTSYWVGRMEAGTAPVKRLAKYWEARNEVGH